MRKFLFLDIDGVLNSQDWMRSDEFTNLKDELRNSDNDDKLWFDPSAIELLNDICAATGCEIVISSSWRKRKTLDEFYDLFKSVGFKYPGSFAGTTDVFYNWIKPKVHCPSIRGLEIRVWLETNIKMVNPAHQFEYTYCILDDDTDMLLEQKNNFVNTDPQVGLTSDDVSKVIRILNTVEI